MIDIGRYNVLKIVKVADAGLLLIDAEGEEILMPNEYCSEDFELDEEIEVFVFVNKEGNKIATNLDPKIYLYEFGYLQVKAVNNFGAFLDWGMPKDLMVPFSEQQYKMQLGEWYVVYFDIEEDKQRLYASSKIDQWLHNDTLSVAYGEAVEVLVIDESPLGYTVIVNHEHRGLIYKNETFVDLDIGDHFKGYVKKIREENKLDISYHPIGYQNANSSNSSDIYTALVEKDGFIALNDKSSPEEISAEFGISKKAFKKAIGQLYKEKKLLIEKDGIRLVKK